MAHASLEPLQRRDHHRLPQWAADALAAAGGAALVILALSVVACIVYLLLQL